MIEQLDNQLKLKPEDSPYWGPIKQFPTAIARRRPGAADRGISRGRSATSVYPALTRLRDFLKNEYLATRATASA